MTKAQADQGGALLGIYLNDHLVGATAGGEMFRRSARSARGPAKQELERLTAEVVHDRKSLLELMRVMAVPVRRYKVLGGWVLEKVGRLKFNGHLLSRSPLSDLVELEALLLGVQGKAAGFRALRNLADQDARLDAAQLDRLIGRAERQAEVLEPLRMQAAQRVFHTPSASSPA